MDPRARGLRLLARRRRASAADARVAAPPPLGAPPATSLLITGLGRGGAETQLVALSRYLQSRGWTIEVVSLTTLFNPERFIAELESRSIAVWCAGITGWGSALGGLWRLLRHLRARRPQVLCTFMFHANILGAVLGRLAGVPVVVSSIRNERFGPRWRERLEAVSERLCDVTVVNSECVATSLRARGIVPVDGCRVIPNAVDLARFAPAAAAAREATRRRLGVPPGAFLWLAVGSLGPKKDHEALLRAAARLRARHPSLRLAIAGDGLLRDPLRRLSGAMALQDVVHWLGLRTDVPDLLAASDAFVSSSRWEGSPNALLEALAAAVPVAATDVGGVRELVEDGRSGFLVPPGDVDALATAMERVMNLPPDARRQMGRHGRQSVQGRHDSSAVLEQWRRLLSDAWQASRPAARILEEAQRW
ncbi:MAG TPA: glycosyltransferase [Methylomirabilota bacterium]